MEIRFVSRVTNPVNASTEAFAQIERVKFFVGRKDGESGTSMNEGPEVHVVLSGPQNE